MFSFEWNKEDLILLSRMPAMFTTWLIQATKWRHCWSGFRDFQSWIFNKQEKLLCVYLSNRTTHGVKKLLCVYLSNRTTNGVRNCCVYFIYGYISWCFSGSVPPLIVLKLFYVVSNTATDCPQELIISLLGCLGNVRHSRSLLGKGTLAYQVWVCLTTYHKQETRVMMRTWC